MNKRTVFFDLFDTLVRVGVDFDCQVEEVIDFEK